MFYHIDLPENVEFIISSLENKGFEAYIVGGCVRDSILGRKAKDWDITTNAKPDEIKKVFKKTVDTGIEHGTVSVILSGIAYEVTTYRLDGKYTDARHPDKVEFTSLLCEDLKRRDFTINAMAYSHKKGLIDLFNGILDIKNKKIACVGLALERFSEDALRMLRAIRFAAELNFEIDIDTKEAIKIKSKNILYVSKERILVELNKILLSNNPEKIFFVFEYLLSTFISNSFSFIKFDENLFLNMNLANKLEKKRYLRWAYFLKEYDSILSTKILQELKSDNDTIKKTKLILDYMYVNIKADKYSIKKILKELELEIFDDLLNIKEIVGINNKDSIQKELNNIKKLEQDIIKNNEAYKLSMLSLNGKDIINLGFEKSKKIGEILEEVLNLVMQDKIDNDKNSLLKYIKIKYKET